MKQKRKTAIMIIVIIELNVHIPAYILSINAVSRMSLCSDSSVLVLVAFRAPGCSLAAEKKVQRRSGKDACKLTAKAMDFLQYLSR